MNVYNNVCCAVYSWHFVLIANYSLNFNETYYYENYWYMIYIFVVCQFLVGSLCLFLLLTEVVHLGDLVFASIK